VRVLTVGYGARGMEAFLDLVCDHGITHLVDVRSRPYSKYWIDFNREALAHRFASGVPRYVDLGEFLGAEALEDAAKVATGLDKVVRASQTPDVVVALMCGCLRPMTCHRGRHLAPLLQKRGVEVLHIMENGLAQPHDEVERAPIPEQRSLF
jgi:uncharacterized protein (DUF488 family)